MVRETGKGPSARKGFRALALAAMLLAGFGAEALAQTGSNTIVVRARGTAGGESITPTTAKTTPIPTASSSQSRIDCSNRRGRQSSRLRRKIATTA